MVYPIRIMYVCVQGQQSQDQTKMVTIKKAKEVEEKNKKLKEVNNVPNTYSKIAVKFVLLIIITPLHRLVLLF